MARSLTNTELATRTSRLKLKLGTRYFQKLGNGSSLLYRRTGDGFGIWSVKCGRIPMNCITEKEIQATVEALLNDVALNRAKVGNA